MKIPKMYVSDKEFKKNMRTRIVKESGVELVVPKFKNKEEYDILVKKINEAIKKIKFKVEVK